LRGSACVVVAVDFAGDVGVWVSEHSVVLGSTVPDWRLPVVLALEEHICGNGLINISRGNIVRTTLDSVVVAAQVAVMQQKVSVTTATGYRSELLQGIAAVVAHGLGTFAEVVVVVDSAISSVVGNLAPLSLSPCVSSVFTSGVVDPIISKTAETFTNRIVTSDWHEGKRNCSSVEGISHVDFVVHVLLSETCLWLLTTHLDFDIGVCIVVGTCESSVLFVESRKRTTTVRGPGLVQVVVPIVTFVSDDTSFVDEAEVIFAHAVSSTMTFCVTDDCCSEDGTFAGFFMFGEILKEAVSVVMLRAVPADTAVTHKTLIS